MSDLTYGPVGDPQSKDGFEYAQAHMPDDWHVEGQFLGAYIAHNRLTGNWTWGRTAFDLVRAVWRGVPRYRSYDAAKRASFRL